MVAVKAFRKGGKHVATDVENEVKALEMMNTLEKDHIVRFLTSFQRGAPDDLEYFLLDGFLTDLVTITPANL